MMKRGEHPLLLIDVVLIVAVARLLGALLSRLGQPAVIGEILGGILLGPTLLGADLNAALFPSDVRPALSWLANVGVVVFLFFVGLEVDRALLRGQQRVVAAVSFGALALPFEVPPEPWRTSYAAFNLVEFS
jgi:Kef-type K+ transport system membrane component KefB